MNLTCWYVEIPHTENPKPLLGPYQTDRQLIPLLHPPQLDRQTTHMSNRALPGPSDRQMNSIYPPRPPPETLRKTIHISNKAPAGSPSDRKMSNSYKSYGVWEEVREDPGGDQDGGLERHLRVKEGSGGGQGSRGSEGLGV